MLFGTNLLCICVNKYENGDHEGVIWNQYEEQPRAYHGSLDLMGKIDDILDELHFPERSNMPREFGKEQKRFNDAPMMPGKRVMHADSFQDKKGELATFIARVKFRQRSTWQGEVLWVEKEERLEFASALEMIKMVDDAVSK